MKILLVNDDGINAPGILALARELSKRHSVTIVAPSEEKSGFSQSLTYRWAFDVSAVPSPENPENTAYSLCGTPADCAKFGVREVFKWDLDLVISGINNGCNLGTDAYYSGTVGAATEAAMFGIPSIAVSQMRSPGMDYSYAARYTESFIGALDMSSVPPRMVININLPEDPEKGCKGTLITHMGVLEYNESYNVLEDHGNGCKKYMLSSRLEQSADEGTDVYAVQHGYISVSPLMFDRTDTEYSRALKPLEGFKVK